MTGQADYRIFATVLNDEGKPEDIVIAHRDNLFAATSVYLDAMIDHPGEHVYLQEQEPATMLNRGYVTIRSSRVS